MAFGRTVDTWQVVSEGYLEKVP